MLLEFIAVFWPGKFYRTSESPSYNGSYNDPFQVQSNLSPVGIYDHKQRRYDVWSEMNTEYPPFETGVAKNDIASLCYEFAHASPPPKFSRSQCYKATEKASPHFQDHFANKEGN